MPIWVKDAFDELGDRYDYIAYRLIEKRDDFRIHVVPPIEEVLQGTSIPDGDMPVCCSEFLTEDVASVFISPPPKYKAISPLQQRKYFFMAAIILADYFRPSSECVLNNIPDTLRPSKSRPRARIDVIEALKLRRQIADEAGKLASLLRKHDLVTQRIESSYIDSDPLQLIAQAHTNDKLISLLSGVEREFQNLMKKKCGEEKGNRSLAAILDELHKNSTKDDKSFLSIEDKFGFKFQSDSYDFYEAFDDWLKENRNIDDCGGLIPEYFQLPKRCWIELLACLTYQDIPLNSRRIKTKEDDDEDGEDKGMPLYTTPSS